ncbi:MAG TPA: SDR family oxidoreductase [Solirubrobacterales bacterium]|nr:SDR family oxidoreductase [Solirubrobacterales bacterium]
MRPPVPQLAGKRCLLTGAASGIGRATAFAAARRGADLCLTDLNGEGLERTAAEIEAAGGRVSCRHAADLSDHAAVRALAAEIHGAHGSIDVVMNVAGVSTWGSIDRLRHSDWQKMIDVNLMGPIAVLEQFVPPMIAAGRGGHVVNVSSAAGLLGLPWHAAYSASKFGLRGVSEVLRFDLRRHRIGVSLVCPGGVRTPLVGTVEIAGVDSRSPGIEKLKRRFEKRAVSPEQVAAKILDGIERNRYLVFTSRDIQLAFWLQRWFPPAYELIMRAMNRELVRVAARA